MTATRRITCVNTARRELATVKYHTTTPQHSHMLIRHESHTPQSSRLPRDRTAEVTSVAKREERTRNEFVVERKHRAQPDRDPWLRPVRSEWLTAHVPSSLLHQSSSAAKKQDTFQA